MPGKPYILFFRRSLAATLGLVVLADGFPQYLAPCVFRAFQYVADKIKTVFKSRIEKGLRCSGSVCYGYRASKEEKGEWLIDEEAHSQTLFGGLF